MTADEFAELGEPIEVDVGWGPRKSDGLYVVVVKMRPHGAPLAIAIECGVFEHEHQARDHAIELNDGLKALAQARGAMVVPVPHSN